MEREKTVFKTTNIRKERIGINQMGPTIAQIYCLTGIPGHEYREKKIQVEPGKPSELKRAGKRR